MTDFATRLTDHSPSPTVSGRYRLTYRLCCRLERRRDIQLGRFVGRFAGVFALAPQDSATAF